MILSPFQPSGSCVFTERFQIFKEAISLIKCFGIREKFFNHAKFFPILPAPGIYKVKNFQKDTDT